jgi:hypothetical protein
LLAEAGHLAIDVQAQAAHVVLTNKEALVVRFLVSKQALTPLNLCVRAGRRAATVSCLCWCAEGKARKWATKATALAELQAVVLEDRDIVAPV